MRSRGLKGFTNYCIIQSQGEERSTHVSFVVTCLTIGLPTMEAIAKTDLPSQVVEYQGGIRNEQFVRKRGVLCRCSEGKRFPYHVQLLDWYVKGAG